jgi:hypothetical protein
MAIEITDKIMRSGQNRHTATYLGSADGWESWEVTWLPARILSRDQAISAMQIAEDAAHGLEPDRMWRFVASWAEELGVAGPDAVALVSEEPQ